VTDEVIDEEPKVRRHEDLSADECGLSWCPLHGKETKAEAPKTSNVFQFPIKQKGNTMSTSTEVTGLDQAINYARAVAGEAGLHGSAGNEGYIGHLAQRNVTGAPLQSAYDMQAAFSAAAAAAEAHAVDLEEMKGVQEQYDMNPDAGDQQFAQGGR
jgi:hypothetical protein